MTTKKYIPLIFILILVTTLSAIGQSLSVNRLHLNEYYRKQQLLGNLDSSISFASRPLYAEALEKENIFDPDNNMVSFYPKLSQNILQFHKNRGIIKLLPLSVFTQYNSHHPEGYNDGAMIPSRGWQKKIDGGVFVRYGILSATIKPEYITAQNTNFDGFPSEYMSGIRIPYPRFLYNGGFFDRPERFGDTTYHKASWGESNIRVNYKNISLGISNENLWWGPGYKNTLLMTNTASGFLHASLSTLKPFTTPIGSFEVQCISGKLEDSGYNNRLVNDWRYMNAMLLSYQPRWVPGLFVGLSRSYSVYRKEMGSGFNDYFPVLSLFTKKTGGTNDEVDSKNRNQLISAYLRWAFPESQAEVYVEYGREDHAWNVRDLIIEPEHSRAYVVGFRKLFLLHQNKENYLQLIGEVTDLTDTRTTMNRFRNPSGSVSATGYWYQHGLVLHGYTHDGQLLGAGIDPSSKLQMIHLSWNSQLKQIGLEFERYLRDNRFWYNYIKDFRSNWVDLGTTLFANWEYKNLLLYAKVKFITSKNYMWLYEPDREKYNIYDYWLPVEDVTNFHMQMGLTYRF